MLDLIWLFKYIIKIIFNLKKMYIILDVVGSYLF